jgi:predicted transcriptional regulator of viral defense system
MPYSAHLPTDRFAELAELAADQCGLLTLQDARSVGYAPNSVAQMARRGRLERVSHSVYRIAFLPAGALPFAFNGRTAACCTFHCLLVRRCDRNH